MKAFKNSILTLIELESTLVLSKAKKCLLKGRFIKASKIFKKSSKFASFQRTLICFRKHNCAYSMNLMRDLCALSKEENVPYKSRQVYTKKNFCSNSVVLYVLLRNGILIILNNSKKTLILKSFKMKIQTRISASKVNIIKLVQMRWKSSLSTLNVMPDFCNKKTAYIPGLHRNLLEFSIWFNSSGSSLHDVACSEFLMDYLIWFEYLLW